MIGPHYRPYCARAFAFCHPDEPCTCARECARVMDGNGVGERMRIALPPNLAAHEIVDSGGIVYGADGSRTSWRRVGMRLTGPDW